MGLDQQARIQWPTPANRDYRSPNLLPYAERGGASKGEQLQNYVEHSFPLDQPTAMDGPNSSKSVPSLNPPAPNSTGSAMDSETLVYSQWARRASQRQGRLRSSATGSGEEESDGTSPEESEESDEPPVRDSAREKKQKKLWAYRQRVMGWANPFTWTRTSFRRKLNPGFVDALMSWPPNWGSAQTACGPEVMALWSSKVQQHLESL